ncbi:hypothetical protein GF385_04020 [Candidatus Dependentiae bacterium]|nr:hypothetical protein [Candidatus Dependentiae bacterium]
MRKTFVFSLLFLFIGNLNSTISFSRQDSKFKLNSNSKLNIGTTISGWSGTLEKRNGSNVAGQNINFVEGILLTENNEGFLTGLYNSTGADRIELQGDGRFNAEPGTVIQEFRVSGSNNRLEGQPLFNSAINFLDSSTSLTIAIQSKLNQNLNLNSGTLLLEDDLYLADNVLISGPGNIILNNQALNLPGKQSIWATVIDFHDAQEINLNGKTILNSTWQFEGNAVLNGNGNILDLSGGGVLSLSNDATLYLVDLYLKGVDTNSFVFSNADGTIYMSNVDVELNGDISMSLGGIYVEGTTTFLLKTYDWTFDTIATLTVDGTTLWLDTRILTPGELRVDQPLFVDHIWQPGNDLAGISSGNFSVLNTGTVRETCCSDVSGGGGSTPSEVCPCKFLYEAPLTSDVDLQCSCLIHPSKTIRIHDDLTINGNGATLFFCDPTQSQFVVLPGKTVTLKNIQFVRLHENTFDLRAERDTVGEQVIDGKIQVDENVEFELAESITFSHGRINLISASEDVANVFYVRGLAGNKNFEIAPDMNIYSDFGAVTVDKNLINTGINTIAFQEIELRGFKYLKTEEGINFVGAIGLVGGSIVNVGDINLTLAEGETESIDKVFVIEGLENKFALLKNNIKFDGSLSFADFGDNAIHFDFILRERIGNKVVGGIPIVHFATDFLQLTSLYGHARLYFDDDEVQLRNEENGFLVFENSFLDINTLLVSNDPIWDLYDPDFGGTPFVIEGRSLESQDIPSPVVTDFGVLSLPLKNQIKNIKRNTALHKIYDRAIDLYLKKLENLNVKEEFFEENLTRGIDIPPDAEDHYSDDVKVVRLQNIDQDLGNASGRYLMNDATITNFYVSEDERLEILMASDSTIEQDPTRTVTLKSNDKIAVAGDDNKIVITNDFLILGDIEFYEDSELTFEFDERFKDLTLTFSGINILDVKKGSRLIFKGKGTVLFSNGFKVKLSEPGLNNKSTIAFTDSASLEIEDDGLLRILGDANFVLDRGAHINIGEGEHLIIGDSIDDNFDIIIDRASVIQVGSRIPCGTQSCGFKKALFSIQKTTASLDFEQASILSIRGDGIFEINALDGVEKKGNLTKFHFDNDGLLSIENLGRLRLGRNRSFNSVEGTINWDNWNGRIVNECLCMVEYVTGAVLESGFEGRLQQNYFQQDSIAARDLVAKLINMVPGLSVSTVFYDIDGKKKLRLKNGLIVNLKTNDQVYSDNSTTGYVYGSNRGKPFVIYLDGTRE